MKLKEMLQEMGILETYDNIGWGAENVLKDLDEETDAQYCKYRWFNGGYIVNAIPPEDMLAEGYPWEEWYNINGERHRHVLFLEKNDRCHDTFDCPEDDTTHPEPTRGHFWYLYEDPDGRLRSTQK